MFAYLSSPYSHNNPAVRKKRYEQAAATVARLIRQNHFVISPVVHCHMVAETHDLPTDFEFWKEYNTELIKRCEIFFVLRLDGWKESRGVMAELKVAQECNRLIDFLNPI